MATKESMLKQIFADPQRRIYFLCFFLSGFCGLLYQTVWLRLAYASFGVVTPVLSIVVSVFMAGLALGSVIAGRAVIPFCKKLKLPAIQLYSLTEVAIGLGAVTVPFCFQLGENWLLSAGTTDSGSYLFQSAVTIAGSLLIWCTLMGFTYPLMMAHIKQTDIADDSSFGFLYWANVCGASCSVIVTAFILIELIGLRACLFVGCALNIVVAVMALTLRKQALKENIEEKCEEIEEQQSHAHPSPLLFVVLFLTGFIAMAFEIIWTRSFMPVLGTVIYSFALLLFVYLISTALGSQRYVFDKRRGTTLSFEKLIIAAAGTALLPTLLNGFNTEVIYLSLNYLAETGPRAMLTLVSIAPFSFVLGYLTPQLIDKCSSGLPGIAGKAYAINSIGCIVGPMVASYILLPQLGARLGGLLLALALIVLALKVVWQGTLPKARRLLWTATLAAGLGVGVFVCGSYEEPRIGGAQTYRDYAATSLLWGHGETAELIINGRRIALIRPWVKMESHLPIVLHDSPVKSVLVICLGMGTSFRSAMSWTPDVTVVELVPGVKKGLPYFYPDTVPNLDKIVVDDGRRYLKRANRMFDIITIDPPPPIEAAGSSLLYSKEFCQQLHAHLNPGGILQLWFPSDERAVLAATVSSLKESFANVRAFQSSEGWGYHLIASDKPIVIPDEQTLRSLLSAAVLADLGEGSEGKDKEDPPTLLMRVLQSEVPVQEILAGKQGDLTDDKPINEYCLIRRIMSGKPEEWHSVKIRQQPESQSGSH